MSGSLNDILPHPISAENEQVLLDLIRRKTMGAARLSVRLLHAMEEHFGPEARQVVRDLARNHELTPRPNPGEPQADLSKFCARLDQGCAGSHDWERVIDETDRVGYRYTRCVWAEIYRELDEPELGFVICSGDEPAVRSFNPRLGFQRTKVLMHGDEECDHVFFVEK